MIRLPSAAAALRDRLCRDLQRAAGPVSQCVFLDYPQHKNAGDYLVALAGIQLLRDVLKADILYTAETETFNQDRLQKTGGCPIFFCGGGNLGDLWPSHEDLRRRVIRDNPDRKIVIMPQAVYYQDPKNLRESARIYNQHPDITIMTRDQASFELAACSFQKCKITLTPDTSFQLLSNLPKLISQIKNPEQVLFLRRGDQEASPLFEEIKKCKKISCEDWSSFSASRIPFGQTLILGFKFSKQLRNIPKGLSARVWLKSWHYFDLSVRQVASSCRTVTDRLHGHILACMLNRPHIFLSNNYPKNKSFYETWTQGSFTCFFAEEIEEFNRKWEQLEVYETLE